MSTKDKDVIKQKLVGYTAVKAAKLAEIKPGDRVRYMLNGELRGGGACKQNRWPDYIVLMNVINKVTWCMQLKDPSLKVWCKTIDKVNKERTEAQKVYELYKQGKLVKKK